MSVVQPSSTGNEITARAELEVQASDPIEAEPTGITRNDELGRYEIRHDGIVAGVLWFEADGATRVFTRVEVEPELREQGMAGRLVEQALEDARADGVRVVPQCPYVRHWLGKHPEFGDLVQRDR